MTTISNKTRLPLNVPLARGKTLHLGPGKTGQISSSDIERPALKKLLDAGQIEIVGEGPRQGGHGERGGKAHASTEAHVSGSRVRSSGDR